MQPARKGFVRPQQHPHLEVVRVETVHIDPQESVESPDFVCHVDDVPDVADFKIHLPLWIIAKRRELARTTAKPLYRDPYAKYPYKWQRRLMELFDLGMCRFFHDDISWDGGPHYTCKKCGIKYAVAWADKTKIEPDVYFKE